MAAKPPKAPRLGYVIIYVPDVQRAVDFYQRAFAVPLGFVHESAQYAELDTGATTLAFADETATPNHGHFVRNRPGAQAAGAEVGFVVDDVDAAFRHALAQGATAVVEPTVKPWGQTIAYVRDLDGFLVELCTAVSE